MAKRYLIEGGGPVSFSDKDYLGEGGEGAVYAKGDTVYKVFFSRQKMVPPEKLRVLNVLDHPSIIRPLDLLLDAHDNPIGYSMRRVPSAVALPRLFTNAFRDANGITDASTLALIEALREGFEFVHHHGILLVDANEMNFLVSERDFETPYFIDVSSYQTTRFPATAIMPSIRDWQASGFSKLTDWFAFAILAFELFTGIHPFKGTHPQFRRTDLEARMRAGVSVFDSKVRLPGSVRPFSRIPPAYRDWFQALFVDGERMPPPARVQPAAGDAVLHTPQVIQSLARLQITATTGYPAPVYRYKTVEGVRVAFTREGLYIGSQRFEPPAARFETLVLPGTQEVVMAWAEEGRLRVRLTTDAEALTTQIAASQLMSINNQLYAFCDDRLFAVRLRRLGLRLIASVGATWQVLPNALQLFEGFGAQSLLGKTYLLVPDAHEAAIWYRLEALDGARILEGRCENGLCLLTTETGGRYDRWLIKLADGHASTEVERDVSPGINFTVLDRGIGIIMPTEGALDILSVKPDRPAVKRIRDKALTTDMLLAHDQNTVALISGSSVHQVSLSA